MTEPRIHSQKEVRLEPKPCHASSCTSHWSALAKRFGISHGEGWSRMGMRGDPCMELSSCSLLPSFPYIIFSSNSGTPVLSSSAWVVLCLSGNNSTTQIPLVFWSQRRLENHPSLSRDFQFKRARFHPHWRLQVKPDPKSTCFSHPLWVFLECF